MPRTEHNHYVCKVYVYVCVSEMCLCVSQTQPVKSSTSVSRDHGFLCLVATWRSVSCFVLACSGVRWHKLLTSGDGPSTSELWADVANRVSLHPPVATVLFQMDLRVRGHTVGHARSENTSRWPAGIIFNVFTEIVDSLLTLRVVWVCVCVSAYVQPSFLNCFIRLSDNGCKLCYAVCNSIISVVTTWRTREHLRWQWQWWQVM